MDTEHEEVVTEEEEITAPEISAEAAADAKVEDGPEEDDSDDDSDDSQTDSAVAGEPLVEGQFTISLAMVIHPSDGHKDGQRVTITATSHAKIVPILINTRMGTMGQLPPIILNAIAQVNGNLNKLKEEAEKKRLKDEAAKEKAKQDAAAAKAKKDAPKLAKAAKKAAQKAKAEKQKADAKAKAEKKKADEKARKEKARIAEKVAKEKAAAKAKADKIKADAKLKADQEKQLKLNKAKPAEVKDIVADLKPGEALQENMFDKLFGGNKK